MERSGRASCRWRPWGFTPVVPGTKDGSSLRAAAAFSLMLFTSALLVACRAPDGGGWTRQRSLPTLEQAGKDAVEDPAAGVAAPSIEIETVNGDSLSLPRRGLPTALLFLAHWCGHCQRQLAHLESWPPFNEPAQRTALILPVLTYADPGAPGYPPQDWLRKSGWPWETVLLDTPEAAVAHAYGVESTPAWVFVGSDGKVVFRHLGEIYAGELDFVFSTLGFTVREDGGASSVTDGAPISYRGDGLARSGLIRTRNPLDSLASGRPGRRLKEE